MRIKDIISLLKEYIVLGIIGIVLLGILFLIGYKIIYKKVMKGKKTISKKKMLLYCVTIGYGIIVLGAVFLNRSSIYGEVNFHLFSSYREAYNTMQISLFRNNVLNILLFVPLGMLLPLYRDNLKKIYKVVPIGFLIALVIEVIQYISKMGIFEIDDIFNNTIGVLIGYSIFMIGYSLIKKENRKYIIGYVLPILMTIGLFTSIYIKYQNQEFGNLPFEYNYKINMKNVNIENKVELNKEKIKQAIYYKELLKEEETRKIADKLFERLGTNVDEDSIDTYENTAIYYSENREHSMWVKYRGGTYSYTNFSRLLLDKNDEVLEKKGATRKEVEEALDKFGIKIPENANFEEMEKQYRFSIVMGIQESSIIDGQLVCSLYEDGTIKEVNNNLVQYEKIQEKEIISEEEAYKEIAEGKFQYKNKDSTKVENIILENIELEYNLDSKGYFVPVYLFKGQINGEKAEIRIKAISNKGEK